jgi:hypothetical protein
VARRRKSGNPWLDWAQIDRGWISSWVGRAAAAAQPRAAARGPNGPDPCGIADPGVKADKPVGVLASPLPAPDPDLCSIAGSAEQQLRILREGILRRDLRFEIMGPPRRLYSNFIRGIRSLPVRIRC